MYEPWLTNAAPELEAVSSAPDVTKKKKKNTKKEDELNWIQLLGIGSQAAGPMLAELLKQNQIGSPGFASPVSLGSKPALAFQQSPYMIPNLQQNQMPGFLAQLLGRR